MKKKLLTILIILLYAPLVFGLPHTNTYKAVWDANTEADLAGYYLYWRTNSGEFNDADRVDCQLNTEYNLSGISNDTLVVLAVTAYDTSGNEGGFSSEVPFNKDGIAPAAVGGLQIVED